MRFLITGITGFSGAHLSAFLSSRGHEVYGTTRSAPGPAVIASASRLHLPRDRLLTVALHDRNALTAAIARVRPDGVFHLAARSSVRASFDDPDESYRVNLHGSLNLFAAIHTAAPRCRVAWIGSSDVYGLVEAHDLPIVETVPFRPVSPYAVGKAAADLAAFQWSRVQGLDVVRLRPFNHTGAGQSAEFVCADFARQLVAAERGARPPRIDVGNLDVVRDFSDVRDVVRAYVCAWERGVSGEAYNVCGGVGRSLRDIAQALIRLSGVTASIATDPQRQRPVDVPVMVGSPAKLQQATGWSPVVSWEQTLRDVLDDWRARLSSQPAPS